MFLNKSLHSENIISDWIFQIEFDADFPLGKVLCLTFMSHVSKIKLWELLTSLWMNTNVQSHSETLGWPLALFSSTFKATAMTLKYDKRRWRLQKWSHLMRVTWASLRISSSDQDIIYLALFAIKAFCCLINHEMLSFQKGPRLTKNQVNNQLGLSIYPKFSVNLILK